MALSASPAERGALIAALLSAGTRREATVRQCAQRGTFQAMVALTPGPLGVRRRAEAGAGPSSATRVRTAPSRTVQYHRLRCRCRSVKAWCGALSQIISDPADVMPSTPRAIAVPRIIAHSMPNRPRHVFMARKHRITGRLSLHWHRIPDLPIVEVAALAHAGEFESTDGGGW